MPDRFFPQQDTAFGCRQAGRLGFGNLAGFVVTRLGRSRPKKLGPSWRGPLAFQVASVGSIRHWQTVTIQVPSQLEDPTVTDLLVMKPDHDDVHVSQLRKHRMGLTGATRNFADHLLD
jgi:hypothetical protein